MKDLSPEAMQQIFAELSLTAFIIALFVAATLFVLGAVFGLLPGVYQDRENKVAIRKKALSILVTGAIVCSGFGFLSLSILSNNLHTTTDVISKTTTPPSYNEE